MDVQTTLRSLLLLTFAALTACSKPQTSEDVFPTVSGDCSGQAIAKRYVVRWANNEVTLLHGESDDDVRQNFVAKNLGKLSRVEPDYKLTIARVASSNIRTFANTADNWGPARINADGAWSQNARGQNVVVAVVDTGVDRNHLQLKDQLAFNPGESGKDAHGKDKATNGIDDDGNGFIDDYQGYDFTTNTGNVVDHDAHGTHVSGIIAAAHSDTSAGPRAYVQGIAPQAKILPLPFIDSSGSGSLYDAMRAIEYATTRKVQVINASWGGPSCSKLLHDQISGLAAKGIIFVSAAGNSNLNIDQVAEYPAAFNLASQLTVGAVGTFDNRADFSNYGVKNVHIFAPGVDIISTVPGNAMESMSGTSMATPIITGAVAALLSVKPSATYQQIRDAIFGSAHQDGNYLNQSHGRIDLGNAVSLLKSL